MAPVRTKRIALVSTTIPNFKRHKEGGGGGGGLSNRDIRLEPTAEVSEGAQPGDYIATIVTVPAGADIELVDDAGGHFDIDGTDLIAGATPFDYETATQHTVVVRATAGANAYDKPIVVSVINTVELSSINLSAATLAENSVAGTIVGALSSTPTGATFGLLNNAGNRFAIVGGNLVAGSVATNFEASASHQVEVQAVRGGETQTQTFTITIGNVAEITGITLSANTTPENSVAPAVIGALTSIPAGATWSLTNNAGNRFAISGNNVVRGATALDYDLNSSHQITVRGTRGGETLDQVFTVNVTNVNGITNITLSAATVAENTAAGTTVGTVASVPAGATLALTNTAGNRFALNGNALQTGATATNYEAATSHDVEVTATSGSDTLVRTFTINVTDVDEISDISLSAATIGEGAAQNAVVGVLSSTPGGATWVLTDNATNRFAITGNNLVRGTTALDYETATSHNVTVQGTRGGETFSKTFTITVTDVDEISDITLSNATVAEDIGAGVVVGALASTPAGGATFSMVDNASNRFAISGTNLVRGSAALDYETNQSHSITVRGTRLNETFDKVFTINVTDVAELTDITLSNASISEDAASGGVVGALASVPAGAVFTMAADAGGRFAINGTNLVRGATALDSEAATSHSVDVTATLNGVTRTETFTINVTDVDEINDITLSSNTIAEDAAQNTVVGTLASNPAGATWTLLDGASSRFAISGNNVVRGVQGLNYETATQHTINVRGTRGGETFDKLLTIDVTDVAELTDIELTGNTIAENAAQNAVVGTLASTPVGATYTLTDNAGNRFAISGNSLVRGSQALDYDTATSHPVTILATLGSSTVSETFTINVTNVNELTGIGLTPSTVAENSAQGTYVGTFTSAPTGASFTLTDTAGDRFALSGANLVVGATPIDYEAGDSYSVTAQANLGADSVAYPFTITVTDVDELQDINMSNRTVQEDGSGAGTPVGTLSSTGAGAAFTMLDSNAGQFTLSGNDVVTTGPIALAGGNRRPITVRGSKSGEIVDKQFDIDVTKLNTAYKQPLYVMFTEVPVNASTSLGDVYMVPWSAAEDAQFQSATFAIVSDPGGRFAITSAGALTRVGTWVEGEQYTVTISGTMASLGITREWTFTYTALAAGAYYKGGGGVYAGTVPMFSAVGQPFSGSPGTVSQLWTVHDGCPIIPDTPTTQQTKWTFPANVPAGRYAVIAKHTGTNSIGQTATGYYLLILTKTS